MLHGHIEKKGVDTIQWVFPPSPPCQRPSTEGLEWFSSPPFRLSKLEWQMVIILTPKSDGSEGMTLYLYRKDFASNSLFQCSVAVNRLGGEQKRMLTKELDFVWSRVVLLKPSEWDKECQEGGIDPTSDTVAITLKIELPLQVRKYDNATTCGLVFTANYVAYRCRTCGISPSMALCSDCFQQGNHEGHDFTMYRCRGGGFCDCGDKSFMRESGFCERHGTQNQMDKPEDLLAVAEGGATTSRETQTEESSSSEAKAISKLLSHLEVLLVEGKDHDVTIKVKEEKFRAHKDLLRCRSPVFAAMFGHDTQENASGTVTVEDCDPEAFGAFLKFVYTGKVRIESAKSAIALYYLADKYDFEELRSTCVEHLRGHFTTATICDVISLAKAHCDTELLRSAVAFFSRNLEEILVTVEWQRFLQQNSTVANELFINAVKTAYNKKQ